MATGETALNLSPARIYVLWHPDFEPGLELARRIYYWFRLENMEGIPVYFRSEKAPGAHQPPDIGDVNGINYIIPLVDANMVASSEWRGYVMNLARRSAPGNPCRYVMLPVAVDPVAYNMPEDLRRMNFIRHDMAGAPPPDDAVLLSRLTEVICRDMRGYLHRKKEEDGKAPPPPGKLKIFLSHAKADETKEALDIKEFIQRETQCEAFFDETDIASGYDFTSILEDAIEKESAGLLVIQGDHYADRPWCRKEIRDFLEPVSDSLGSDPATPAYFIPPVVVVQTMQGKRVARSIPELGHAPCVRWQEDSARFVVTTLLREILLGLFYRLISRGFAEGVTGQDRVFINRTPDPVMVERILALYQGKPRPDTFVHPGYGLSTMDRKCLKIAFPHLKFVSFSQLADEADGGLPEVRDRVIAVSVGNSPDILQAGAGDEHDEELLRRLLRPLFRKQASLLYGGSMPKATRPLHPWKERVNFTGTFLELLLTERNSDTTSERSKSRLYNLSAWEQSADITPAVRAQWNDLCSFVTIGPEKAGLGKLPDPPPEFVEADYEWFTGTKKNAARSDSAEAKRKHAILKSVFASRCLSEMRRMAVRKQGVGPIPPDESDGLHPPPSYVTTLAHIYLGGKITNFAGIMPGIFEEMLYAFDAGKPVFVIKAGRGAAGLIADWLTADRLPDCPDELTVEFHSQDSGFMALRKKLMKLRKEKGWPPEEVVTPDDGFDQLWSHLKNARNTGLADLMRNGLDDNDNRRLLNATSYLEICELVWRGISRLATSAA